MPPDLGRTGTLWALGGGDAAPALLCRVRWCCLPIPPAHLGVRRWELGWCLQQPLHTAETSFVSIQDGVWPSLDASSREFSWGMRARDALTVLSAGLLREARKWEGIPGTSVCLP